MYRLRFQHRFSCNWFEEDFTSVLALLCREEELTILRFAGLLQYHNFSMVKIEKVKVKTTSY